MQKKNKSIVTGPKMTWMIELVDKDIKNQLLNCISYVWYRHRRQ